MSCKPNIPAEATAGLDFQASVFLRDYPSNAWTMKLVLRGPASIDMTAVADGLGFLFSVPASATEAWAAGVYWYSLRASQTASVVEIDRGQMNVIADLAAVTGTYDGRTQNEIALDAIDAVIGKRATVDQQRYKINERELWRMSIADLMKLRAYLSTQVRRERARLKGCSTFGRPVVVRFNSQ